MQYKYLRMNTRKFTIEEKLRQSKEQSSGRSRENVFHANGELANNY